MTSTRILYKNSSASLNCISISELCRAIDRPVATEEAACLRTYALG